MKKRGQVSIFIIIAVVIVAVGVLIYLFYPQIIPSFGAEPESPSVFIKNCIDDKIESSAEQLSLQGGSMSPEHYMVYDNGRVEYLCYTNEYHKLCVMQQPMLKQHIESEIKKEIADDVESCFDNLETSYGKKGYGVNLKKGGTSVELLPGRIVATFNHSLTLTKGDSKQYEAFRVAVNNNLYELVSITDSILNSEAHYGDAETTIYMNYYRDLKVEKKKQSDGTTIYILTDTSTGDEFRFASRSNAWPPGYNGGVYEE